MSGLSLKSVRKHYGGHQVLHGVDLEAKDGEFVVLVGPSGCGKSTLLRMIAGLDTISDGELEIGGQALTTVPPQKRNIAMVFQSYALFPHLRVRKNISFGMELRGADKATIATRTASAAQTLNLTQYLDRFPRELSGGQRQRVAMARALVREPSLYLMDEPLSNLDAQLRVRMRAEIKALHQRLGNTIVYVTHDQVEAMTLADRLVVMRAGRIEQVGTPLEVYDRPANTFVAEFLGSPSINLFPARVDAGVLSVANSNEKWILGQKSVEGGDVVAGVRPDCCSLSDTGVAGRVTLIENMGSEATIHVNTQIGDLRVVARERVRLASSDLVHVSFSPHQLHLFNAADGRAL